MVECCFGDEGRGLMLVFRERGWRGWDVIFWSKRMVSAIQYSGPQLSMTQLIAGSLFELNDATCLKAKSTTSIRPTNATISQLQFFSKSKRTSKQGLQ